MGFNGYHSDPTTQTNALLGTKTFAYATKWRIMSRVEDEAHRVTENAVDAATGRRTKETIKAGPAANAAVVQVTDFEYGNAAFPGVVTRTTVEKVPGIARRGWRW